jgi:hypothetical protein
MEMKQSRWLFMVCIALMSGLMLFTLITCGGDDNPAVESQESAETVLPPAANLDIAFALNIADAQFSDMNIRVTFFDRVGVDPEQLTGDSPDFKLQKSFPFQKDVPQTIDNLPIDTEMILIAEAMLGQAIIGRQNLMIPALDDGETYTVRSTLTINLFPLELKGGFTGSVYLFPEFSSDQVIALIMDIIRGGTGTKSAATAMVDPSSVLEIVAMLEDIMKSLAINVIMEYTHSETNPMEIAGNLCVKNAELMNPTDGSTMLVDIPIEITGGIQGSLTQNVMPTDANTRFQQPATMSFTFNIRLDELIDLLGQVIIDTISSQPGSEDLVKIVELVLETIKSFVPPIPLPTMPGTAMIATNNNTDFVADLIAEGEIVAKIESIPIGDSEWPLTFTATRDTSGQQCSLPDAQ